MELELKQWKTWILESEKRKSKVRGDYHKAITISIDYSRYI